jgi:hypothetical protein
MYSAQGQLGVGHIDLVGKLEAGGASAISASTDSDVDEGFLDAAAIEAGTD